MALHVPLFAHNFNRLCLAFFCYYYLVLSLLDWHRGEIGWMVVAEAMQVKPDAWIYIRHRHFWFHPAVVAADLVAFSNINCACLVFAGRLVNRLVRLLKRDYQVRMLVVILLLIVAFNPTMLRQIL